MRHSSIMISLKCESTRAWDALEMGTEVLAALPVTIRQWWSIVNIRYEHEK